MAVKPYHPKHLSYVSSIEDLDKLFSHEARLQNPSCFIGVNVLDTLSQENLQIALKKLSDLLPKEGKIIHCQEYAVASLRWKSFKEEFPDHFCFISLKDNFPTLVKVSKEDNTQYEKLIDLIINQMDNNNVFDKNSSYYRLLNSLLDKVSSEETPLNELFITDIELVTKNISSLEIEQNEYVSLALDNTSHTQFIDYFGIIAMQDSDEKSQSAFNITVLKKKS